MRAPINRIYILYTCTVLQIFDNDDDWQIEDVATQRRRLTDSGRTGATQKHVDILLPIKTRQWGLVIEGGKWDQWVTTARSVLVVARLTTILCTAIRPPYHTSHIQAVVLRRWTVDGDVDPLRVRNSANIWSFATQLMLVKINWQSESPPSLWYRI